MGGVISFGQRRAGDESKFRLWASRGHLVAGLDREGPGLQVAHRTGQSIEGAGMAGAGEDEGPATERRDGWTRWRLAAAEIEETQGKHQGQGPACG